MLHRWAAPALVLALCALVPEQAAGQSQQSTGRKSGGLGQNYPNPFNPETHIPIHVGHSADHASGQPDCTADMGKQHVVTLRIYNVIGALVAIPTLQASTGGGVAPSGPLNSLVLQCGDYLAFWDGRIMNSSREVPSGVYVAELIEDGRRSSRKMFVAK